MVDSWNLKYDKLKFMQHPEALFIDKKIQKKQRKPPTTVSCWKIRN